MQINLFWWKRYKNRARVENKLPYQKPAQRMLFKIKEASREMIDYKQLNKYKQYVTFILFLMQTSSNWYKSFYSVTFSIIQCFSIYLKGMKTVRLWNTALSHDIEVTDFWLMSFHKPKWIILKTGLSKLHDQKYMKSTGLSKYMNINNHGIKI